MKEQFCKYRLPCSWCDKYDRRCEHIEALIAKADWEVINKCECKHDYWIRYDIAPSVDIANTKRRYLVSICSKCGKATVEEKKDKNREE